MRLPNAATMFEQGAGRIDLLASFDYMRKYKPSITLVLKINMQREVNLEVNKHARKCGAVTL